MLKVGDIVREIVLLDSHRTPVLSYQPVMKELQECEYGGFTIPPTTKVSNFGAANCYYTRGRDA